MYRGRGNNHFRRGVGWRANQLGDKHTTPELPIGSLLESVRCEDLSEHASSLVDLAHITDAALIASYNWLDTKSPTILIPGTPPKWTPPRGRPQLKEDNGVYYRDKNASRFPQHPMEPMIEAIMRMQPKANQKSVDIVACGSTMGNLLRFVRGEDRKFRMLVEVVGNAVHLIRRENSPTETLQGVRGYGHTFPEAYTTWDPVVKGSSSHQRIMKYDFGSVTCIVRHEGVGYLPGKTDSSAMKSVVLEASPNNNVDSLIESLEGNMIHTHPPSPQSQLKIDQGGCGVPQSAVFDLKTRSNFRKGNDFLGEEIPRMWVSQIPNFVLAYHTRGVFDDIEIIDVSSKLQEWESKMSNDLSKLAALLRHIIEVARKRPDNRLEICRNDVDKLDLREQTAGMPSVLSEAVMRNWVNWLQGVNEVDEDEFEPEKGLPDDRNDLSWDNDSADFTACSASSCGYCGRCTY